MPWIREQTMVAGTEFKVEILETKTDETVCRLLRQIPYFSFEPSATRALSPI